MKQFVHHDSAGTIHSLIRVDAPDGVEVMLEPEPWVLVTELEGVELELEAEDVDAVHDFIKSYKVAVRATPTGRLIKKD